MCVEVAWVGINRREEGKGPLETWRGRHRKIYGGGDQDKPVDEGVHMWRRLNLQKKVIFANCFGFLFLILALCLSLLRRLLTLCLTLRHLCVHARR